MLIKLLIWPRNKIENRKGKEKMNNNSVKDMSECTYCKEQEREREKEVIGCEYKRRRRGHYYISVKQHRKCLKPK